MDTYKISYEKNDIWNIGLYFAETAEQAQSFFEHCNPDATVHGVGKNNDGYRPGVPYTIVPADWEDKTEKENEKMKIKIYECIIDDGDCAYKEFIPGTSKEDVISRWGGNGEFVKIEEAENFKLDVAKIIDALMINEVSQKERDVISRTLKTFVKGCR